MRAPLDGIEFRRGRQFPKSYREFALSEVDSEYLLRIGILRSRTGDHEARRDTHIESKLIDFSSSSYYIILE